MKLPCSKNLFACLSEVLLIQLPSFCRMEITALVYHFCNAIHITGDEHGDVK